MIRSRESAAALALFLLGCAGAGSGARGQELEAVRSELRALRAENERLAGDVDALERRMDFLAAKRARPAEPAPAEVVAAPVVPPDLAIVRMAPPRGARTPPPLPTSVPIAEPDAERLEGLARRSGRELAADADAELARARAAAGLDRAHALEDFVSRYPRHPSADNALVEAAAAYAAADRGDAACTLAGRAPADYPAGDAMSDALERLAWCESRRGQQDAERRLLRQLVADYPRSPAAERAGARLAAIQRSDP
jgi:TolA-binding protein